jgi:hypothetical protein
MSLAVRTDTNGPPLLLPSWIICVAPPQRRYVGDVRHIVVVMSTDDAIVALANPVRRLLLEIPADGQQTAGALSARFALSRRAVAEQLNVLRDAGPVTTRSLAVTGIIACRQSHLSTSLSGYTRSNVTGVGACAASPTT